jgi:hypothetical protein
MSGRDFIREDLVLFGGSFGDQLQQHNSTGGSSRRVKRRDSHLRRHTLQGGVDVSMVDIKKVISANKS